MSIFCIGTKRQRANSFSALVFLSLTITAAAQSGPACNPKIDRNRSLVVTDAALDRTKFAFARTVDAILESLNIPRTAENRESFVKSMLASFNAGQLVNLTSGLRMEVHVRALEAALDPKKLLDPSDPTGLVPIGLFNRLDLAPVDFSNCGEHRIVYSFKAPIPPQPGIQLPPSRFFLIFEARLDNASPQKSGFEGCRAAANFWRDLSDEDDAAKRAQGLEAFYYAGISGSSGPIVQAKNYGAPLGQVRGNVFLSSSQQPPKWELREWVVINAGDPTPASFIPVTVKNNPLVEFYQDANASSLDPALETTERIEFQKKFANEFLTRLLETDTLRQFLTPGQPGYKPELDPKHAQFKPEAYKVELFNRLGARFDNRFNEFQGVSQGDEDNPRTVADAAGANFKTKTQDALNSFVFHPDQKPNLPHVLNRAGAVTCGGCHQFTAGQPVGVVKGNPILWPASANFVHIREEGQLSPALTDAFLPFRQETLRQAVCTPQAPVPSAMAESAPRVVQSAQEARLVQAIAAAREAPQAARQSRIQDVIRVVSEQRQEESQKEGFFVTNRRPH